MKIEKKLILILVGFCILVGCQKSKGIRRADINAGLQGIWQMTDRYCADGGNPADSDPSDVSAIKMEITGSSITQSWTFLTGQSQTQKFAYKTIGRKLLLNPENEENSETYSEIVSFKVVGGRNLIIASETSNCGQETKLVTTFVYVGEAQTKN